MGVLTAGVLAIGAAAGAGTGPVATTATDPVFLPIDIGKTFEWGDKQGG